VDQPIRFLLNHESVESSLHPGTVVLDFLRRDRRLSGTKEGCREGDCGACMVLLGELSGDRKVVHYKAVNSCLLPLGDVAGKHLVSIEGLNPASREGDSVDAVPLTPVQQHLVDRGAIQCGFCTPGFVVALTGYLLARRDWSYSGALEAVAGNICRCTGYASIKRAIGDLLDQLKSLQDSGGPARSPAVRHLEALVACRVVPEYFLVVPHRLRSLKMAEGPGGRSQRRTVVAGGTDLFVQKPEQLIEEDLSFVSGAPRLRQVRIEGHRLTLGAAVTMEEMKDLPEVRRRLPQLVDALTLVASAPIRHRATIGGNIVNASPIGDFTVMLLALGAVLGLSNGRGIREVELKRFFRGYKQLNMKRGERLEWIALPLKEGSFHFEKVSRRRHLDIASVNSAAWISIRGRRIEKIRLAAGGVAPVPLYLARVCASLEGEEFGEEGLERALIAAQEEISPISDVRGSEAYKRLLLRQLLLAHFQEFFPGQMHAEVWV
jgi:xanthine dehydrogenase small subunit